MGLAYDESYESFWMMDDQASFLHHHYIAGCPFFAFLMLFRASLKLVRFAGVEIDSYGLVASGANTVALAGDSLLMSEPGSGNVV